MNQSNNRLIAGPWVGEFGWELFAWQGYIRSLSKKYEETIIICRENSKHLYSDFAKKFIVYEPSGGPSDSYFREGFDINSSIREIALNNKELFAGSTLVPPRRIGFPPVTHYTENISFGKDTVVPNYIVFGSNFECKGYDYVFHIRNRELRKQDNWDIENWEKLKDLLGEESKIACIGTKKESLVIEGTDDLRDTSLEEVCGIINKSKVVFGPSSGPMHLASLCNTPHVVWSRPENKTRYEETWNPLKTPVLFMSEHSWHPSPEYVYKKFINWIYNK